MSISQEIESRINIVELVSRYVPLKKAGANYKALSPFIQEKTPSFMVSPAKNIAYCFSSRRWGGPIKFLAEIEKIDYREAMQILAREAGIELKTDYHKERGSNQTSMYDIYKHTANWYHEQILKWWNEEVLEYAKKRWLTLDTLKNFSIWYAPNSGELWNSLIAMGIPEEMLLESGIFIGKRKDKFNGRLVFPIANFTGNTVGFTGRIIGTGDPKYLNSPASKIFNKSEILYGLHLAKSSISKLGYVIIVEWQMDTVKLHQAGFTNSVGISWTALTKEHIRFISRLTQKLYLCLDSDKAGINATFSSLDSLLWEEIDTRIIRIDGGKDPDEFIESGGNFNTCIEKAISPVEFYVLAGATRYDLASFVGKTQILREVLKYVRRMTNAIEADMSIKYLAKSLDISESAVLAEYKNIKPIKLSQVQEKREWLDFWHTLVGYMSAYFFYDLFLKFVDYNEESFEAIPWHEFVRTTLRYHEQQIENPNQEELLALELIIESENEGAQSEAILTKFKELVKHTQKLMFKREQEILSENMDTNSNEYLLAYSSLLNKWKKLGLI
jgi:DNA primase